MMREIRCCVQGNFSKTRLLGKRLSGPIMLQKARLKPLFQWPEKKLAVFFRLQSRARMLESAHVT